MALTGPGFFGGGRKSELVSLVDLCPTLLDACGIKPKKPMQGRSFLPLIHGQCEDWQEEVFVQISESQVGRAVRTHRWKYGVNAVDAKTNNDQYASEYAEEYLYDLREDPYETRNLAGIKAYRHIADIMMERLLRRMKDAGEPKAVITAAPERSSGQLSIEKGEEWK
jgi:arylsulfatase A-like enzyme